MQLLVEVLEGHIGGILKHHFDFVRLRLLHVFLVQIQPRYFEYKFHFHFDCFEERGDRPRGLRQIPEMRLVYKQIVVFLKRRTSGAGVRPNDRTLEYFLCWFLVVFVRVFTMSAKGSPKISRDVDLKLYWAASEGNLGYE